MKPKSLKSKGDDSKGEVKWGPEWKNCRPRNYTREEFRAERGDPARPCTKDCTLMDWMDRFYRSDDSEKESDWEQRTGIPFEPDKYQKYFMPNPCRCQSRFGNDCPYNLRQFDEKYKKCYPDEYTTKYNSNKKEVAKMLAKTYPHLLTWEDTEGFGLFDWAVEEDIKVRRPTPYQMDLYNAAKCRYWGKIHPEEAKKEAKEEAKKEAKEKAINKSNF